MRLLRTLFLTAAMATVACTDDEKRPIGTTCGGDSECESGLCSFGQCLDPAGDEDLDGLTNGREGALGSNPLNPDSDYDGIPDAQEFDGDEPADSDSDSKYDIVESLTGDTDGDCLPDQLDPDDSSNATAEQLQAWASVLCGTTGVCKDFPGGISVTCGAAGDPVCDYSGIAQFQATETTCDGLDNDCDGASDEGNADSDGNGVADCVDTDVDGDDVANGTDNCVFAANADQADADADGAGDACDAPAGPALTGFTPTTPANVRSVTANGTSEPLATVTVYSDALCATAIGNGTATASGAWTATVTLAVGANTFALRAVNPAGLSSPCVASSLVFDVDQAPPAAPVVFSVEAASWDESGAAFTISGESELGATVRVFSDAACATPVSEGSVAPAGLYSVTTSRVANTVQNLFVRAIDTAGNAGPCGPAGPAFGTITVEVNNSEDKPVGQVAVQFHYPDGTPVGVTLYTDANGLATVEGFAGFGATVDVTVDEWGTRWSSVLGIKPGQTVPFVRRVNNLTEVAYISFALTFPAAPEETSWVRALAPCGYYYLAVRPTATTANVSIAANCFTGSTFDIALVAVDGSGRQSQFVTKTGVPIPDGSEASITFDGAWSNAWTESEVTVTTSVLPSQFYFGSNIMSGEDVLDYGSEEYTVSGFAQPSKAGTGDIKTARIPGAMARWWIEVPFIAATGEGRVGMQGAATSLPFDLTFDVDTDFMPRIFAVRAEYAPAEPEGGARVLPIELFWDAEPGLSRSDALTTDFYIYGPNSSVSWDIVARPSEKGSLRIPAFIEGFPGLSTIESAYYGEGGNITFFDADELDGFDDAVENCASGQDCALEDSEMSMSTCCDGGRNSER